MFSKIALLALLVASVNASGGYSSFSYGVSDPNTGDIKDQHEKRVGGNVVGKYSLLESDGTKRVVEYSADDATGFKAVVHKEPVGAGAIGAPHSGALAHGLPAAGALGHGALAAGSLAGAHANPWAAGATPLAQAGAFTGPLAHGASNPLAYGNAAGLYGQAGLYGHGGLYGQAGLHGQAGQYGGYGNPLAGSLGAAGYGAPTVSSYSHRIVHNGPDAFPYGRYGAGGYGAHGAGLAGSSLAGAHLGGGHLAGAPLVGAALSHANPWASGATGNPWANSAAANPWANGAAANPWANSASLTHGSLASPVGAYGARGLGYGSQLGW